MKLTMVGRLSECYLLAYRTTPERAASLLPRGLEPSTHEGDAFWNVVVSKVDKMRPLGTPRPLGGGYVHIAYRIQARARTRDGGVFEGLFFVRSDVDDPLMALVGNRMTDFRFHVGRIGWREEDGALAVDVTRTKGGIGDARLRVDLRASAPPPPPHLRYRPYGLSVRSGGAKLRLAEVFRDESRWSETPVRVAEAEWGFFKSLGGEPPTLVAATRVAPLDYRWRIGRTLPLASDGS